MRKCVEHPDDVFPKWLQEDGFGDAISDVPLLDIATLEDDKFEAVSRKRKMEEITRDDVRVHRADNKSMAVATAPKLKPTADKPRAALDNFIIKVEEDSADNDGDSAKNSSTFCDAKTVATRDAASDMNVDVQVRILKSVLCDVRGRGFGNVDPRIRAELKSLYAEREFAELS